MAPERLWWRREARLCERGSAPDFQAGKLWRYKLTTLNMLTSSCVGLERVSCCSSTELALLPAT